MGLIPTMGYLHQGHLALIKLARNANSSVVTTIFINPAQFGPNEDEITYPKDIKRDLALLSNEGVDFVFTPSAKEIYPRSFDTEVNVGSIGRHLEGISRPRHFQGVATVMVKLIAITHPDRAYFGQKDAQQCLVVKQLNDDLNLGVEIVVVPTVREHDGLAFSSRNYHLGTSARRAATVLYRSLTLAKKLRDDGVPVMHVRDQMQRLVGSEPLAKLDYISIAHPDSLEELDSFHGPVLISLAVTIAGTRLIDNMTV